MNDKKLKANRENARKSTGPKTQAGRAASSRNAVKHGLLATAPVLPGIESAEAWEEHRTGIVNSLAPVGYIENFLAERIALLAWRLHRVVRYEVEVTTASAATAEIDMEAQLGKLQDPVASRARAHGASFMAELLEALPGMPADEKVDPTAAVCCACSELLPGDAAPISIPETSGYDGELSEFDNWTAGLLRNAIDAFAAAGKTTAEALLKTAILSFRNRIMEAEEEEERRREWQEERNLQLERKLSALILLEPDVLEKVATRTA